MTSSGDIQKLYAAVRLRYSCRHSNVRMNLRKSFLGNGYKVVRSPSFLLCTLPRFLAFSATPQSTSTHCLTVWPGIINHSPSLLLSFSNLAYSLWCWPLYRPIYKSSELRYRDLHYGRSSVIFWLSCEHYLSTAIFPFINRLRTIYKQFLLFTVQH